MLQFSLLQHLFYFIAHETTPLGYDDKMTSINTSQTRSRCFIGCCTGLDVGHFGLFCFVQIGGVRSVAAGRGSCPRGPARDTERGGVLYKNYVISVQAGMSMERQIMCKMWVPVTLEGLAKQKKNTHILTSLSFLTLTFLFP